MTTAFIFLIVVRIIIGLPPRLGLEGYAGAYVGNDVGDPAGRDDYRFDDKNAEFIQALTYFMAVRGGTKDYRHK